MTSKQFHALAMQLFAHGQSTSDPAQQSYWAYHFAKLINLVRRTNIYGG